MVTAYVNIQKDNLNWCRQNQKTLRADNYNGLKKYLEDRAHSENIPLGKLIILPSTFVGSPRYMQQLYQDAMAEVRHTGKPHIFLTMTCNPNWKEIRENLLEGQQPSDRPDLIARVFNLKKTNYSMKLFKKNVSVKLNLLFILLNFKREHFRTCI